jgi:hypothetical protein
MPDLVLMVHLPQAADLPAEAAVLILEALLPVLVALVQAPIKALQAPRKILPVLTGVLDLAGVRALLAKAIRKAIRTKTIRTKTIRTVAVAKVLIHQPMALSKATRARAAAVAALMV